ncbi:FadR/GntR family transcriptional regulator [Herbaspirillum sp. WKF16]|jgi:DNA-binding FadR family transcriptional regulator|uniref:FadR/GntR family transcriptional regulator n=1 Tax=Herbaspirillum sp. WKF16 TaxID=3028312 RepID=UPI0023A9FBDA|nr:FadR/GntR family transcriptional regulator [Herbaspirillum sp. WKF16]WDZ97431.1 FadR/GntR family transcriptional regulator [Herbaspirillum sp. WKF16]
MPIEAIEPQRLYLQISAQLRKLIVDGEFAVGSRLPSERDLAVQLGVSRPSLREALIALEVEGYIEVRMGSGIYVCPPAPREGQIDLSSEEGPLELIRAREMIEGEVAYAAARNAGREHIEAIEEAFQLMIAHTDAGINPLEADRLFHIRLAEATGNSVLVGLVTQLFDARLGPLFKRLHSHFDSKVVWYEAIDEHALVIQALRERNPDKARAAMRRHMDISFTRYSANLILKYGTREKRAAAEAGDAKVAGASPQRKRAPAKLAAAKPRGRAARKLPA